MSALEGSLAEALAGKTRVIENATTAAATVQEWLLPAHSILVVAEKGIVSDLQRAIETHRGMGVATTVGIVSGTPDEGDLDAVTAGTVTLGRARLYRARPNWWTHPGREGGGAHNAPCSLPETKSPLWPSTIATSPSSSGCRQTCRTSRMALPRWLSGSIPRVRAIRRGRSSGHVRVSLPWTSM